MMHTNVLSDFEFDFFNVYKEEEMWSGKLKFEQKFLSLYSCSPETVLTGFETGRDKFTADLMGYVIPEEIAHFFNVGQINITNSYFDDALLGSVPVGEEIIKIVNGKIIEHLVSNFTLMETPYGYECPEPYYLVKQ